MNIIVISLKPEFYCRADALVSFFKFCSHNIYFRLIFGLENTIYTCLRFNFVLCFNLKAGFRLKNNLLNLFVCIVNSQRLFIGEKWIFNVGFPYTNILSMFYTYSLKIYKITVWKTESFCSALIPYLPNATVRKFILP